MIPKITTNDTIKNPLSPWESGGVRAFTLIELLIGVTLSAILMTGIVVFVGSSLGSNMAIKKVLEEGNKNRDFEQRFTEVLGNITGSGLYTTGATFSGGYLTGVFLATLWPNLPITFLGLQTQTGYCDSYSGTASETGTIMKLVVRQLTVPIAQNTANGYTLSYTGNTIFSWTTSTGTRIIGTGYPGNILDTTSGALTELSSPSALISSGNHLYIADTMNDRVLSYDITFGRISKLLGPENGIQRPTSLYFSGSTLLIASSGNGKIYSLQDGDSDGSNFSSTFQIAKNFSADNFRFTFSGITSITAPTSSGSFIFSGFNKNSADITSAGSEFLTYSGSLQSFSTGSTYNITIGDISGTLTNTGNNIVRVDFLSGGDIQYSDVFHYYSKWDGSLESSTGNILKVVSWSIIYPHNIIGPPTAWSGTIDWSTVLGQNPLGSEIFSSFPVEDLTFQKSGKVLTIRYHEYIDYDCMLGKHRTEERIKKVLLP